MTERIKAFVRGMGRAVDLGASQRVPNLRNSSSHSDSAALASDWRAVGNDMSQAIATFSAAHAEPSGTAKTR